MAHTNQELFEIGKMPPHSLELEEAVLGSIMLEKDAINEVSSFIDLKTFYSEKHYTIYRAIHSLFNKKSVVDILSVTEELKKSGDLENIGGAYYITQLTNRVASSANIQFHAAILKQYAMQRELIRVSSSVIQDCYNNATNVFDTIGYLEKSLTELIGGLHGKSYSHISEVSSQVIKEYNDKEKTNITGVPSKINDLDRKTGGFQNSDLIIMAARPGMGKTALALTICKNAAEDNIPIAIFSLEMTKLQLTTRMIAMESRYSVEKIGRRMLMDDELPKFSTSINKISSLPIYIDDTGSLGIREFRSKCSKLKRDHDIGLIILDYIQLMHDDGVSKGNREQEISRISRALKGVAKDLNVPIIALSQLSRQVESRNTKVPLLSDLRESGSIEQDADMVMFIYRPDYYDINAVDDEGNNLAGIAKLILAKHRNGSTGDVLCRFVQRSTLFENID